VRYQGVAIVHKGLHAVQAGGVERDEQVERREKEGARPAGRIEDSHMIHARIEGQQQSEIGAACQNIAGELLDGKVQSNKRLNTIDGSRL